MDQRSRYKVHETYTLDTRICNGHTRNLILHSHALPKLLEWPPCPYYTLKGIPLEVPEMWSGMAELNESSDAGYDFSTPATVIPFIGSKRSRS